LAEIYGQLSGVSAILAGFAITFLALLLGHKERSRCLSASIAVTTVASACLLVSALGWTLIGSLLTQVLAQLGEEGLQDPGLMWVIDGHRTLSYTFIVGLLCLFSMLGLSGWLKSRLLGVFSTATAIGAAMVAWSILQHTMG
jgi:hypothetical protein